MTECLNIIQPDDKNYLKQQKQSLGKWPKGLLRFNCWKQELFQPTSNSGGGPYDLYYSLPQGGNWDALAPLSGSSHIGTLYSRNHWAWEGHINDSLALRCHLLNCVYPCCNHFNQRTAIENNKYKIFTFKFMDFWELHS